MFHSETARYILIRTVHNPFGSKERRGNCQPHYLFFFFCPSPSMHTINTVVRYDPRTENLSPIGIAKA